MQSDAEFRDALIKRIWEWFEPEHAADELTQRYMDAKIMPLINARVAEARLLEVQNARAVTTEYRKQGEDAGRAAIEHLAMRENTLESELAAAAAFDATIAQATKTLREAARNHEWDGDDSCECGWRPPDVEGNGFLQWFDHICALAAHRAGQDVEGQK